MTMKATLALSVAGLLIVQPTASGGVEPDSRVVERLIEGRSLEGIAHTFDELPGDHFNKNAGRGT
jgi:hypothetical protein